MLSLIIIYFPQCPKKNFFALLFVLWNYFYDFKIITHSQVYRKFTRPAVVRFSFLPSFVKDTVLIPLFSFK